MKGVIPKCLNEMVVKNFSQEKWENILLKSGLPADQQFFNHHEIDDNLILKVVENTCEVLGITLEQAADAFGDYWMTEFAPKKYYAFVLTHTSAKSFLLSMSSVHKKVTTSENANPPSFTFEELDDKRITMTYSSKRNLEVFWLGLIRGVGNYFKENIDIKPITESKVELTFG
jgi:hypothetical protein